jgi:hypothetical protein
MYNQLDVYFSENNLYYCGQYGYRKNHSTELAALELVDRNIQSMDAMKTPVNIYLDLSKAFDCIDHEILIYKLKYYGISEISLKLLTSYLSNRHQYVKFNKSESTLQSIAKGVPQGSIMGPLLFNIYVNDFPKATNFFHFIMYADDTTLFCNYFRNHKSNLEISNEINYELNRVSKWINANKLSLNTNKTKFMLFYQPQGNQQISLPSLNINSVSIEHVSCFNFFGIRLDNHLKWKFHTDFVINKLYKTMGIINKLKYFLPQSILLNIYNSLILPHLNYGSLLWSNQADRVMLLQKKIVRIITRSSFISHTDPLFKRLKFLKLQDIRFLNEIKFYFKLKNSLLPVYFINFLTQASDVHNYPTRNQCKFYIPKFHHEYVRNSLRYSLVKTLNECPDNILEKIFTHSIKGLNLYVKNYLISLYNDDCTVVNCYVCSKN